MTNKQQTTPQQQDKAEAVSPDPETLHTPDPQEKMEGPISTLMHKMGEGFDTGKSKEEADEEKEKNM
jgi:hypothetical protein